ncbi:MAG: WYL domain-containing protein [Clostridia bacterium]|nr:WYL domain-containing protein [Clostridia bacterium]
MEEFEYEDDWDEEEDDDEEEGGWGLSAEEIERRVLQVNEAQDKRNTEIYRKEEAEQEQPEEPSEEPEEEQDGEENKPKSRRGKRSKRQGLKLLLIREYIYNEASKEHPKNATHIRKFLKENYDIEATDRTIHTDIKRLRKDVGVPILYNPHRNGYYIAERQFSIAELRLLVDCIRNASFITKDDEAFFIEKLKGLASAPDREVLARQLDEEDRKRQTDNSVLQNVALIVQAIEARKQISFNRIEYVAERETHTTLTSETVFVSPHRLIRKSGKYILEYAVDFDDDDQLHTERDVALMDNIKITLRPSTYRKLELKPGQQTEEEALEWLYGGKRAVTIRFRNDVLDEVVNELDEEAIIVPVDDYHFKTTVRTRVDRKFLRWIRGYDCYAKILAPQDVVEYYLDWRGRQIHELETLYREDLEPIGIISLEEYDKLTEEQYKTLVYDLDFD